MQINTVEHAARQQVRDEVLSLIRSRASVARGAMQAPAEQPAVATAAEAHVAAAPVQVENAVQAINETLKVLSTSLRFEVDEQSGRTLVKVIDGDSGELLRQIPSEAALQISRSLHPMTGHLIRQAI